ncbi:hypothetical protein CCACVL1_02954 [Corchorus capsularis]|uniref:Uncharacterized protein n=1 Tax=Corchorus capsularis TaxID=210143 RepID=A0A1R3K4J6_COCAP|nr:hypothetical protein CCACVL1_02954 [Corchorus capsularis]
MAFERGAPLVGLHAPLVVPSTQGCRRDFETVGELPPSHCRHSPNKTKPTLFHPSKTQQFSVSKLEKIEHPIL